MSKHINEHGRFQSDKYPALMPDKVVIDLTDPEAWAGMLMIAQAYKMRDSEFAADLEARLWQLREDRQP